MIDGLPRVQATQPDKRVAYTTPYCLNHILEDLLNQKAKIHKLKNEREYALQCAISKATRRFIQSELTELKEMLAEVNEDLTFFQGEESISI